MGQLDKYDIFQELCKYYPPPVGYKKIRVNLVYDVNNYRLHKSRLVAYGHLTDIPIEEKKMGLFPSVVSNSLYLFLLSIKGKRGINILETCTLNKRRSRKFYIIAWNEFDDTEGHILIIDKALYGLRYYFLLWYKRIADYLRYMGLFM